MDNETKVLELLNDAFESAGDVCEQDCLLFDCHDCPVHRTIKLINEACDYVVEGKDD